jgi:hypothetical protein
MLEDRVAPAWTSPSSCRPSSAPSPAPRRRWCTTTSIIVSTSAVRDGSRSPDETIREFKELTKYL